MIKYTTKQIREFIACPQFGDLKYGKWGGLRLEQREAIYNLIKINESADSIIKYQIKGINELKRQNKILKEALYLIWNEEIEIDYDKLEKAINDIKNANKN